MLDLGHDENSNLLDNLVTLAFDALEQSAIKLALDRLEPEPEPPAHQYSFEDETAKVTRTFHQNERQLESTAHTSRAKRRRTSPRPTSNWQHSDQVRQLGGGDEPAPFSRSGDASMVQAPPMLCPPTTSASLLARVPEDVSGEQHEDSLSGADAYFDPWAPDWDSIQMGSFE